MITVTLFTKDPCSLCEQVKDHLATLQQTFPHRLEEVDITLDEETFNRYRFLIPVVHIGDQILQAPITLLDLSRALHQTTTQ